MKHFIDTLDYTPETISSLLKLIHVLKKGKKKGYVPSLFFKKTLAMIFEEPSTRTRVSFEVAAIELGGGALYLKPGEIHLGVRESIKDSSKVISSMCDLIMIRALKHHTVTDFAKYSSVPVINGLTDINHPTQALCDVFTMWESLPKGDTLRGKNVVFVSDRTNVCSSTMWICAQMGMNFTHVAPKKYQSPQMWIDKCAPYNKRYGTYTRITDKWEDIIKEADFIYTDLWWWVDQEDEAEERKIAFMPYYQVNEYMISHTKPTCKIMHCLPASRNVEITDGVIDGEKSIVFAQAENRLSTERALIVWMAQDENKNLSKEVTVKTLQDVREALTQLQQINPTTHPNQ